MKNNLFTCSSSFELKYAPELIRPALEDMPAPAEL